MSEPIAGIEMIDIEMIGVKEYAEDMPVCLAVTNGLWPVGDGPRVGHGRLVIRAVNEGGYNCTEVDLEQLISWLRNNRPELLN